MLLLHPKNLCTLYLFPIVCVCLSLLFFFLSADVHVTFDSQSIIFAELSSRSSSLNIATYYFTVLAIIISVIIDCRVMRKKISFNYQVTWFFRNAASDTF